MDETSSRESSTKIQEEKSISNQIDRLIDTIDNNTYAMRKLAIALSQLDQDEHMDEDGKISTYLDGTPR
jgi:hypothetical protein